MTTIDRYIRRATVGLPTRERVDTAAELRVHLNERVRALAQEGFARDEAEHLVVERMGPVDPVNRQFLGHAFTVRIGWTVAALLVIGVVAWFAANYLFAPELIARSHELTPTDVLPLIGDLAAVDLTLPPAARSSALGFSQDGRTQYTTATPVADVATSRWWPRRRVTRTLVMGFPAMSTTTSTCRGSARPFVLETDRGSTSTCMTLPPGALGGTWHQLTRDGLPVRYDVWQPILAFEPTFQPAESTEELINDPNASFPIGRVARPDDWIVLSAYTSRAPLEGLGELPLTPTGSELLAAEPWLRGYR